MKHHVHTLLFLSLIGAVEVRAAQFWYDPISEYPRGGLTTNTAVWYPHSPGNLTAHDALVVSNSYTSGAAANGERLRINGLNSEYIMRLLDPATTNTYSSGVLYASFIVSASFVPSAGAGTYFATFNDVGNPPGLDNGFEFRGRVYEIGNTNNYPFTTTTSGTYRFGVSNAAGDPAQGGGPSILYVPIDLTKNIDYQVVLKYIIDDGNPADAATATIWINPASESDLANRAGPTADAGAITTGLAGLLFRQRTGGGTVDIRDVAVGTTFADVVTNTAPGPVLVATNYVTLTNYAGNPALLEVFATSIGGGPLSYQWYQLAGGATHPIGGATNQTYVIEQLSGPDTGNYFCAVTNSGGLGAVSGTNYAVLVNTTPTPPTLSTEPKDTTVAIGANLTLKASAFGTGPLIYQWNFNNAPLTDGQPVTTVPGDASVVTGSQTPTLTVNGVSTNDTGTYTVTVSTTRTGVVPSSTTSSNATISVKPPQPVTIAYLRSLVDTNTWAPTDTTSLFTITGVVTTATNVTSGNTSSYYLQDDTAGINLFISGDSSFRPARGDLVTATGSLFLFNNNLELDITAGAAAQTYSIVSHGNPLPAPYVFDPSLTNNPSLMETNLENRFIMLTNVYFPLAGTTFTGGESLTVTNQSGGSFTVFVSAQCTNVVGQAVPSFASSLLGPIVQFKSGAYSTSGYEVYLTSMSDLVTNAPPAVDVTAVRAGTNLFLNWTVVPYSYSYSIEAATNVIGPYNAALTGLTFTNSPAALKLPVTDGRDVFYRIVSP
jgi:hypothetical protein